MKVFLIACLLLVGTLAVQNTAQASMQAAPGNGPAQALIDHLNAILTDIRLEQSEHQALYDSQSAECNEEIDIRTTAITDGEDALARAQAHQARCFAGQQEAQADIAQVAANIAKINTILTAKKLTREEQAADFKILIEDELEPAISAVKGAFPIIDSFTTGGASFAQVTAHMAKSFKLLVQAGKASKMAAPLSMLASLGQDFDQAAVTRVRELFQALLDELIAEKAAASELEQNRIQAYTSQVAEFNTILDNLVQTNEELVAYEAEMSACLIKEGSIVQQAAAKVKNNREALAYAIQMCTAFEEEFQNASAGRKAEIQLLEKLLEFIDEQAEIFGDYGTEESGVFEAYKSEYEKSLEKQVTSFIEARKSKNVEHLQRMKQALKV